MKTSNPKPTLSAKLSSQLDVTFASPETNAPRQFSGIANSGLPFERWGDSVVIECF